VFCKPSEISFFSGQPLGENFSRVEKLDKIEPFNSTQQHAVMSQYQEEEKESSASPNSAEELNELEDRTVPPQL